MTRDAVTPAPPPAGAVPCPACRSSGATIALTPGASLEGCSCRRCGGTLLPTTGSERLLHEELALDRAALVELAESFGGRRFGCPSCTARMRSLILRGVDVDLCFHCGALWLDQGELERLSGNRHRGLAPTMPPPTTTALQRPEATVRLDARHPMARRVGSLTRLAGVVVGAGVAVGLLSPSLVMPAAAAFIGGMWLRRRRVVDVFPRARRFLRSRRWMPADPRDDGAERLDERTYVVVRPFGSRWLAASSYVDSCGRVIAPLESGGAASVLRAARLHARKLGAALVIDRRLDGDVKPVARALPVVGGDVPFAIRLQAGPSAYWSFEAVTVRREPVFMLQNAVPARGNEERDERLALCFCLERKDGTKLRLHDDGNGHTVVVAGDGEPVGSILRRGGGGFDWLTFSLAGRATRIHLLLPPLSVELPFVDDGGARCGSVALVDHQLRVTLRDGLDDETRFACVLLAAHAALDAGRWLESR